MYPFSRYGKLKAEVHNRISRTTDVALETVNFMFQKIDYSAVKGTVREHQL